MSLATWAALPTSVWMRMYAVTTSNDLLAMPPTAPITTAADELVACRERSGRPLDLDAPGYGAISARPTRPRCRVRDSEPSGAPARGHPHGSAARRRGWGRGQPAPSRCRSPGPAGRPAWRPGPAHRPERCLEQRHGRSPVRHGGRSAWG